MVDDIVSRLWRKWERLKKSALSDLLEEAALEIQDLRKKLKETETKLEDAGYELRERT